MKNTFKSLTKSLTALLGAAALTLLLVPTSYAACGAGQPVATHASWSPQLRGTQGAHFVMASDLLDLIDPIVGMWHVKFVAKGSNNSAPVTDGVEMDAGYSVWHGDGTEIMNSGGRAPKMGDFCLGVWQRVGERGYKLNHFAAGWDPTGSNFVGAAQIQEQITLDRTGNSFSGTFTIDQYSEVNGVMAPSPVLHFQGNITGTRMTVNTPAQSIF
jgi:hypothetical protein